MKILKFILVGLMALSIIDSNANNKVTLGKIDTLANDHTMNGLDTHTYLALGDSYTIGESVLQSESYPYQLTKLLASHAITVQPPTIIAVTGWTTDDLIGAIAKSGLTNKKYDFVTLLIGVNDQYQGLSQTNYRTKFIQVLKTAIKFAGGDASKVFVVSIPDWGVTPFAGGQESSIGPQIDQFNAINKAESLKAGVKYVDITPISKKAATEADLVAPDGLHPSGKMYSAWVNLLEPVVAARLKK